MGIYNKYILPKVIHFTCSTRPIMRQRIKVVPHARGRVLEVGIGSGLNLPFYDTARVTKIWGLEPSPEMTTLARKHADALPLEVEFIGLPDNEIPLEDKSIDTVVMTYTLCSMPDPTPALRQMGRVLKPGGELLFCEHGSAPDESVRRWQERINPIWKRLGGGCNLNRDVPHLLESGGFKIKRIETMYLPGWRPANFNYWGAATVL